MKNKGTYAVQDTSTTLLRNVADTQHARWAVFHSRYEPMMRAFIKSRFPSVDADDVIQETFVALARAIPHYTYNPKENGHFRNYLTGILRNKALKALARRQRDSFLNEQAAAEIVGGASANEIDYREWRESVYEIALQQLLADESIHERTKQVFVRLAIDGEKPEAVAESLGIPYNTVIRIRKRAIARLRSYVEAMKKA
jgi:RNA polymerase sigma factor (sigma-70 family)